MRRSINLNLTSASAALVFAVAALAPLAAGQSRPFDPSSLPRFESKYYLLYTDLDRTDVQDVSMRITKMAEVYRDRTRDFSGSIRSKLPFVLFRDRDDYLAAGGPEGSAGLFNGKLLMAVAGEQLDARSWYIIQHEGFHQFAAAVIGGDIPTWANEGLADYFGEALYTGDDMITGIIPEWRRKRVKQTLVSGKFMPIEQLMRLSLDDWNGQFSQANYDQAWSIVQFLAHGDGGKYQRAFGSFMGAIARGKGRTEAWQSAFGDSRGLEDRWRQYWSSLPENPTDELYQRATVATLTSYIARTSMQKQGFDSIEAFIDAAKHERLKIAAADRLPRTLLATLLHDLDERRRGGEQFRIERADGKTWPRVVLQRRDGKRMVGRFKVLAGKITTQVEVEE